MSFSAIESTINSACIGLISNASMTWGATTLSVVFDAAYADPLGMTNNQPRATCLSSLISAMTVGASVSINSISYTVQAIEPDGGGMSTLILRRA